MEKINNLQNILGEQLQLTEKLLMTVKAQTDSLVEDNLSKMMRQNEELEALSDEMQSVEEQRLIATAELAEALELEQGPTLQELAEEPRLPEEFRQIAATLWERLQQLKEQNELNEMLLKQSMLYNQKMQLAFNQKGTYQPDGKLEQRKISSLLDHSI